MIFTSFSFVIFFLLVYGLYLAFPGRAARHWLLLLSSSIFYGWWDWRYLGLMWTVILVAHGTGLLVERKPERKKLLVGIASALLLLLIALFKYNNFFLESFVGIGRWLGFELKAKPFEILLPVGISFYVFHGISYIVDVYRGIVPAQRNPIIIALYISYFPQLVAGPIVRASEFIPQLLRNVVVTQHCVALGLKEFTLGLLYKMAFADNLAPIADEVFAKLATYDNAALVCASFAFYGQIYFDFAGY